MIVFEHHSVKGQIGLTNRCLFEDLLGQTRDQRNLGLTFQIITNQHDSPEINYTIYNNKMINLYYNQPYNGHRFNSILLIKY